MKYEKEMKIGKKMRKTLFSITCVFGFFVIYLHGVYRQPIQLSERIKVAPEVKLLAPPSSFCVTKDGLVLIPDRSGKVKVLKKAGNLLKLAEEFGNGKESFTEPRYCFYNQDGSNVGILDYGVRKVYIFNKTGKGQDQLEFKLLNSFFYNKNKDIYDIKFSGDSSQCIISGYVTDNDKRPFDLYGINIKTGQIDYLLFSPDKYGMPTYEAYVDAYFRKQTLPAIGTKGFFDAQGEDLFYIWEGNLRIIKFNLRSKTITQIFGQETSHYVKPDGSRLSEPYIKGDFKTTWELQKSYSYVRNIFATSNHVFVVYETGEKNENNSPRMQIYTIKGDFIKDRLIPGNPGRLMSFDKSSDELYVFTDGIGNANGEVTILKYKISITR